ncbi:MAG: hypothetical protein R6W90_07645 [Ignavibacteriaceae bacterium]
MKKGMTIMIYKDPHTRLKKEGTAKLVKKISERSFGSYKTELWNVRFPGKKFKDIRTIREEILPKVT